MKRLSLQDYPEELEKTAITKSRFLWKRFGFLVTALLHSDCMDCDSKSLILMNIVELYYTRQVLIHSVDASRGRRISNYLVYDCCEMSFSGGYEALQSDLTTRNLYFVLYEKFQVTDIRGKILLSENETEERPITSEETLQECLLAYPSDILFISFIAHSAKGQ